MAIPMTRACAMSQIRSSSRRAIAPAVASAWSDVEAPTVSLAASAGAATTAGAATMGAATTAGRATGIEPRVGPGDGTDRGAPSRARGIGMGRASGASNGDRGGAAGNGAPSKAADLGRAGEPGPSARASTVASAGTGSGASGRSKSNPHSTQYRRKPSRRRAQRGQSTAARRSSGHRPWDRSADASSDAGPTIVRASCNAWTRRVRHTRTRRCTLKIGAIIPQGWTGEYDGWQPLDAWRRTTEVARQAERLGFESIWLFDHFTTTPRPTDEITFESFTSLAALAALTERVRLGHIVICTAFRNPALTAKMISTMDSISGGRMELGIGAGWKRDEWRAYGYEFPDTKERLARLADDLGVITAMLAGDRHEHATFDGERSQVRGAINVPKPIQQPRVPIMVGGNGPNVTWRLAARHADELNLDGLSPAEVAEALPVIRSRCEEIDRDPRPCPSRCTCGGATSRTAARPGWISSSRTGSWASAGSWASSRPAPTPTRRSTRSSRTLAPPVSTWAERAGRAEDLRTRRRVWACPFRRTP